jgi:hypothetical protein
VSISVSISNKLTRGSYFPIQWMTQNSQQGMSVRLALFNEDGTQVGDGGIITGQPTTGSHQWLVPLNVNGVAAPCSNDGGTVCPSFISEGRRYKIRAIVYTPQNAVWGYGTNTVRPQIVTYVDSPSFTVEANVSNDTITLNQVTGVAPLPITLTANLNGNNDCSQRTYTLDFGDGQRSEITIPMNACRSQQYIISHGYAYLGTYYPRLYLGTATQVAQNSAPKLDERTLTLTGTASTTSTTATTSTTNLPYTLSVAPNGAARTIQAQFQLLGAACSSYNWGDGSAVQSHNAGTQTCGTDIITKTFTHAYTTTGSFVVQLKRGQGPLTTINTLPQENATVNIGQ